MNEPILDVFVEFDGPSVSLSDGRVLMIPFKGTVSGPVFKGIVEPCGVDTQTVDGDGARHMSARYMLTGKDADGVDCRIYVENDGWFADGHVVMPFRTVPRFRCDSPKLKEYLEQGHFYGMGVKETDGLHIRFFENRS